MISISNAEAFNGRPAHCPQRAWCGCYLANHFGYQDKALWKASQWAKIGRRVPYPMVGAIAVYPHHVGVITGVPKRGEIVLLSGNDGNQVRERSRSTKGIIAFVQLP